jgi:hypothetical protein
MHPSYHFDAAVLWLCTPAQASSSAWRCPSTAATPSAEEDRETMSTTRGPHLRHALVLALLAMLALSGCGRADEDGDQTTAASGASTPSTPSPAADEDAGASNGTPIRITFGDTELTARLDDTATARDLAAQLPLTLTFRDHNAVEKTAPLPRELSLDGAPGAHNPAAGDIGYWAPDADLVLYYDDDAPAFDGIVRIGEIDDDVEALNRRSGDFEATVERAP